MRLNNELFRKFNAIPNIPNKKECWGKKYSSKCPCSGILTAIRNRYTGKISASCDNCNFKIIE